MENSAPKAHPLILVAATAVIVASLAAIAAIFGWLPIKPDAPAAIVAAPVAAPVAPPAAHEKTAALDAPSGSPVAAPVEERPATRTPAPRAAPRPAPVREPLPVYSPRNAPAAANYPINDNNGYADDRPQPGYSNNCRDCGTVENVREITQEGQGSGIGAVAGGVLGGVLGHQVGGGRGRDVATVAGALGGAYAGNEIEKSKRSSHHYQITVRMDNGTTQTITESQPPMWRNGDRVRVGNGRIVGL